RALLEFDKDKDGKLITILIDYCKTHASQQKKGFASRLITFLKEYSSIQTSALCVMAIDSSVPFWTKQNFIPESDLDIIRKYNSFEDTTLMKFVLSSSSSSSSSSSLSMS